MEPILDEATLRQVMRIRLETGRSFTAWLAGEHVGRRKMQALEFEDYRGYVPGDDFRLIDWNSYARLGELFVKTSLTDETVSVFLLVDCSKSMDWGTPNKLRYAERLAGALGALALMHGDRVQVVGLGNGQALSGTPLHGPGDLTALSANLEALPVFGDTDLHGGIAAFQQTAEPHGVVVLLSDLLVSLEQIETLDFLELEGRTLVVIHIVDPNEAVPNLQGAVELRDSETGAVTRLSISAAVRGQYIRQFEERTRAIQERLATGDVRYVFASTAIPPIEFVANGLRREGLVSQA
ncbi:MAG: DUF58 domain-containing protein [Chloroflexota bacterium]